MAAIGLDRTDTKFIVVCGSGHQPGANPDARRLAYETEGRFDRSHCPYHYVIRNDGKCEAARALGIRGKGKEGFNAVSVWVCLTGGLAPKRWWATGDYYSDEQKASLRNILCELLKRYPMARIVAFDELARKPGEVGKNFNPGFNVQAWLVDVGLKHNPPWWANEFDKATYGERV